MKGFLYFITLSLLISCNKPIKLSFSEEEADWLAKHPKITLSIDDTYPPLNYRNERNQLTGYNVDLIEIIGKRLGVEIVLEGSDWNDALLKAMNNQVDGIVNATPLDERRNKLVFTNSITQDPQALVTQKLIESKLDDFFEGTKIAVKKNSHQLQLLKDKSKNFEIVEVNTLLEGISLLTLNKVDGVYDDLAPLYYFINSNNLSSLQVSYVEYNGRQSSLGLRKDDPILLSVFNKAIHSITETEKSNLKEKWINFKIEKDLTTLYFAITILAFLIIVGFVWNWLLNRLVAVKTRELKEELKSRKEAEINLKMEQVFASNLLDAIPGVFFMYKMDPEPHLIRWNKNNEDLFKYTPEELLNQSPSFFAVKDDQFKIERAIAVLNEKGEYVFEINLITKDKIIIPHLLVFKKIHQKSDTYVMGFGININAQYELLGELKVKNKQLLKYSFDNAHLVRGSLARILGLLNLSQLENFSNAKEHLQKIDKEAKEMDKIIRNISEDLYNNSNS